MTEALSYLMNCSDNLVTKKLPFTMPLYYNTGVIGFMFVIYVHVVIFFIQICRLLNVVCHFIYLFKNEPSLLN